MDSEAVISIFKDIDICSCIISRSLWDHFDIVHSLGTLLLHGPCAKQRFQTEDRAISMAYTNHWQASFWLQNLASKIAIYKSNGSKDSTALNKHCWVLCVHSSVHYCFTCPNYGNLFHPLFQTICQATLHCPFCEISV